MFTPYVSTFDDILVPRLTDADLGADPDPDELDAAFVRDFFRHHRTDAARERAMRDLDEYERDLIDAHAAACDAALPATVDAPAEAAGRGERSAA